MNRVQAVSIYKEIVNLSENVCYNAFNLQVTAKNGLAEQNYQLRIMMTMDGLTDQLVKAIAAKHNLRVKVENGEVVLFGP